MDFRESGKHSNTFAGTRLACAASLATLERIEDEGLVARSAKVGAHLAKRLDEMAEHTSSSETGVGSDDAAPSS